jgi:hypothetical protein
METFVEARPFLPDPDFDADRKRALKRLNPAVIDPPIVEIIRAFSQIPWCFTLQSCWGHFVHAGQTDRHGCEPLANFTDETRIEYRLAYLAICLKDSPQGRALHDDLRGLVRLDPANVQFGSAEWFWDRQVNSYAVQVEPERFKTRDHATLGVQECLKLEKLKANVFAEIRRVADRHVRLGSM